MSTGSPSTTDRLAEIRARLDAASKKTTLDVHAGGSTLRASVSGGNRARFVGGMGDLVAATVGQTGPLTVTVADDEDGQDATLALHARDDLAYLLAENARIQERLDTAESRVLIEEGEVIKRDKAIASLERALDEQRWYGEQLQASLDSCSGNHLPVEEYPGNDEPEGVAQ